MAKKNKVIDADDHPLTGRTFNVAFRFNDDGTIKYVITLPNLSIMSGTVQDMEGLAARLDRDVEDEADRAMRTR